MCTFDIFESSIATITWSPVETEEVLMIVATGNETVVPSNAGIWTYTDVPALYETTPL